MSALPVFSCSPCCLQIELGQAYNNITGVRIWGPVTGTDSFDNITIYLSSSCGYLNGVVCATGVRIQSGVPVTAACTQTTSKPGKRAGPVSATVRRPEKGTLILSRRHNNLNRDDSATSPQ